MHLGFEMPYALVSSGPALEPMASRSSPSLKGDPAKELGGGQGLVAGDCPRCAAGPPVSGVLAGWHDCDSTTADDDAVVSQTACSRSGRPGRTPGRIRLVGHWCRSTAPSLSWKNSIRSPANDRAGARHCGCAWSGSCRLGCWRAHAAQLNPDLRDTAPDPIGATEP